MLLLGVVRSRRWVLFGAAGVAAAVLVVANADRLPGIGPAIAAGRAATSATVSGVTVNRPTGMSGQSVVAVDEYLQGMVEFDARKMWGAMSDELIEMTKARGGTLEGLQRGLDEAKRQGGRYEDITMIANYPLQDGRKFLFYVLSRRGFGSPQLEQVFYVFTVGANGKISRID